MCKFCSKKALSNSKNSEHEIECLFNPANSELEGISFNTVNENNINNIGVYKITTPTGKIYIGMTSDSFKNRWYGHLKKLEINKHHCSGLQRAFIKYGWDSLSKEIIEEYNYDKSLNREYIKASLLIREKEIWTEYNKNYVMLNGEPSGKGSVTHTEETRKRISKGNKENFKNNRKTWEHCKVYFLECQNVKCNEIFCSKKKDNKYCSNQCRKITIKINSSSKKFLDYSICYNNSCCNYSLFKYCSDDCNKDKLNNTLAKARERVKLSKEINFLYNEKKLTVREIANELDTTHTTIINIMKTFNIESRTQKESSEINRINKIKNNFSYEELYHWHIDKNMSISAISKSYNNNRRLVKKALDFYGISK